MKKDDITLGSDSQRTIRKYADLLLRKSAAYGRFPTPVADIVGAANLEIARESALAQVGLDGLYRRLPNALKLAPDTIKRAAAKVLGVLDRDGRAIHLDPKCHAKRKMFITVHEVGHDFLPHQRRTYSVMEDSESELDINTADLFEREANCFASDVLFQLDAFTKEAAEFSLGVRVPVDLSKKYGPSVYAATRRYVCTHRSSCALVVYNQPVHLIGVGDAIELRRAVSSPLFEAQFGFPKWPSVSSGSDVFFRNRPKNKFSAGREFTLIDLNGDAQRCVLEAFDSTSQILFLIYPDGSSRAAA